MTFIFTIHPFWGYVLYALMFAMLILLGGLWILGLSIHWQQRRAAKLAARPSPRLHVPDAQWYAMHRSPFVTEAP